MEAILQDLGLQDIARIDGWVKVDRPDPPLPEFELEPPESGTAESDSTESDSANSDIEELPDSEQPITDSSGMETYDHTSASEQLPEVVEQLPDNVFEYNSSPISQRAVPILPLDLQAEDADDYTDMGSEYVQAESQLVGAESAEIDSVTGSDDVDAISTDTEEADEGSLLLADASPQELCMYVKSGNRLCVFGTASAQGSKHCLSVLPEHHGWPHPVCLGCCIITMQCTVEFQSICTYILLVASIHSRE